MKEPLKPGAAKKYFENRLGRQLRDGENAVPCVFHDDGSPSLSINTDKAVWRCHAGCGDGGILAFEMRFSECGAGEAWVKIEEITGQELSGGKPEAIYVYTDEQGIPLFRKIRYPRGPEGKKPIFQQRYTDKGRWETGLNGVRSVPYNLQSILVSNVIIVCEGEKCCDKVDTLSLYDDRADVRVSSTTAPSGSSSWEDWFGSLLTGKVVLVFPDNDDSGRKYANTACQSAKKHSARLVKQIALPGLKDGEDIFDYLALHTKEELAEEIRKAPVWKPPVETNEAGLSMFVDGDRFIKTLPDEIEWLVAGPKDRPYKGIIQRGTNGFILAYPKSGKSLVALDLCISLALGEESWLGFKIPRRAKVAIVSREDYSGMTGDRLKQLLLGKPNAAERMKDWHDWFYINTRTQTKSFLLDNDSDMDVLLRDLSRVKCDFLLMDVFRRLHMARENESDEMQPLLEKIGRIQSEVGCAVAIIHHVSKALEVEELESIFRYARGSSTIHGWMEFGLGIGVVDSKLPQTWQVRKMVFSNKAGGGPDAMYWKIDEEPREDTKKKPAWMRLVTTDKPGKKGKNKYEEGEIPF